MEVQMFPIPFETSDLESMNCLNKILNKNSQQEESLNLIASNVFAKSNRNVIKSLKIIPTVSNKFGNHSLSELNEEKSEFNQNLGNSIFRFKLSNYGSKIFLNK